MSTTENMIVTENIGLKAPKEDAFYEVGYIAENNEIIDRKFADVGNLEDMNSEIGASTMVEALNLTFQSGNEKRGILASNLVAMGVEADASETWDILLPKVKDISTGVDTSNDTVVAEVLLEGYTAHDANQEQIVGTLPDKTGTEEYTATATLDSTNSELQMTIPAMGKYGTNNKLKATFAKIASLIGLTAAKLVKGNTILGITGNSNNMDTSVGTITSANQLLKGIIGCSDGKTYTGTVVDRRGTTVAATAVSQDDTYTYFKTPAGCYSEESMVRTENSNLNKQGTFAGTELQYVECGFRPTHINILVPYSNGSHRIFLYNANYNVSVFMVNEMEVTMPSRKDGITTNVRLYVDDNGFYFLPFANAYYYASK